MGCEGGKLRREAASQAQHRQEERAMARSQLSSGGKAHTGVSCRLNQEALQMCQEEVLKLEDEVYREAEEKALLREALERTQVQLGQEKRLNRVVKQHKVRGAR